MREHSQSGGFDISELPDGPAAVENLPPFALALLPIISVIVLNFVFIELIVPAMDTSYLAEGPFRRNHTRDHRRRELPVEGLRAD